MIKPNAKILDATSGNRGIWTSKDDPRIVWIDIESELEVKPDRLLDCTNTDYPNEYFTAIFFDPPNYWGDKPGENLFSIRNKKEQEEFYQKRNFKAMPWGRQSYYGSDKYQSKLELLSFIHKSQREFYRILKKDGILWLKWNEQKIPLYKIIPFFKDWREMMKIYSNHPKASETAQTYWLMFMKKLRPRNGQLSDYGDQIQEAENQ